MNASPSTDDGRGLDWWLWPWRPPGLAPQTLTQPINPGWSFFSVTTNNSSAPQTERDIVERHSYGRQIGRLIDAVSLLLDERGPGAPDDPRAAQLRALQRDIEAIKCDTAERRLEAVCQDLALLKGRDAAAHARLAAALRAALDDAAPAGTRRRR